MHKLFIAAAGAGKTKLLVDEALLVNNEENVLITTYTEANEAEIRRKFLKANKCVPSNITIQTWFSFLLHHGVRPFQKYIIKKRISGLHFVQSQSGNFTDITGMTRYYAELNRKYYVDNENRIYSDKLSKFVVKCNDESNNAVLDRISRIYSHIFVDEVQDLAGYDLDILRLFFKLISRVLLVGDPRQVTYLTHHERKHSGYAKGKIRNFIEDHCQSLNCSVDESTLTSSYRSNAKICAFSSKLFPELPECKSAQHRTTEHDGIFWIRKRHLSHYLDKFNPVQLRSDKRTKVAADYKVMNFGKSKGLSFDRVLIYPTAPILQYLKDAKLFKPKKIKGKLLPNAPAFDRSKFYVAITRARFSVAIVVDDNFSLNSEDISEYIAQTPFS